MNDYLTQLNGNVGQDPKTFETSKGEVVKFSLAVTMKYGQGEEGLTRWVNVSVFNDDLRPQVLAEISKGTKVAVEGKLRTDREYKGEKQYDLIASRVGLVKWFTRSKSQPQQSQQQSSDSGLGW